MQIGSLYIGKYPERLKELERSTEKLKTKLERAEIERDVLREERDESSEVVRLKLKLEGDELAVKAKADYLDKREEYLDKLASSMKWDKAHATVEKAPENVVQYRQVW